MVKNLLYVRILPFILFVLIPQVYLGQGCPTSLTVESNPGTVICQGESIEFTAKPIDGTNLTYQWRINGAVYGTGKTISISGLNNKDKVRVEATSSDSPGCSRLSNEIHVTVDPKISGTVKIQTSNRNICPGETVNFSITSITNPGNAAVYKWQLTRNGSTSILSTSNNLSSNIFKEGDKIQLLIIPSIPCMAPFSSEVIQLTEKSEPPSTPAEILGETSVCAGSQVTYTVNEVSEATEYIWMLPTGWTGTSTSNEIIVTPGTENGNITVKSKNDCGESSEQILSVSSRAAIPSAPDLISGATEICPGTAETYSIPEVDRAMEYLWKLPTGWSGSSNTNSINVISGSENGIIEVQAKNNCGTSIAATLFVNVKKVTPATPSTISGPAEVCPESSEIYSISEVLGASEYIWTLPQGWTGTSTSNSIRVTAASSGNGEITVKAKNGCGTSEKQQLSVSINPEASVNPVLTGNTIVCPGENGIYSINAVYDSYNWSIPPGWMIEQDEGNEIKVTTGNFGENGVVKVTAKTSCGSIVEAAVTVQVVEKAPVAPQAISGPAEICATETTYTYSVTPVDGVGKYHWRLPSGWNLISGGETNSVTVSPSSTGGEITVFAENGCGRSGKTAKNVVVIPSVPDRPGEITTDLEPNLNICEQYGEISFSVPTVPNASGYNWILPAGWIITSGSNTPTITVRIDRSGVVSGPFTVKVEAINSCGTSNQQLLENIICKGNSSGNLPEDLFAIYISNSRELIIRNPKLMEIQNIYLNNLLGQQIVSYHDIGTLEEIRIPVKQITPGVYLFRIHSEYGILTKQIMLE